MNGVCPNCRTPGDVGVLCTERVCAKRKLHIIPEDALRGVRTPDELIGLKLGNYLLINLVGSGGFGRVYHALRLPLEMHVAVKILHEAPTPAAQLERRRLFAQEAKAMARLSHPNIVRLLDFGGHEGTAYLVTELLDSKRTLKNEVRARATTGKPVEPWEVKSIVMQIVSGLEAAHNESIIHRDIKPENIILQVAPGHPDFVRILDFGLAKFVDERSHTQSLLGTPMYMAPEQMEGRHIGPWTDLYALGVIAYELMTGYRPFPNDAATILRAKRNPSYDVLESLAGLSVPEPVRAFFRKALAQSPDARYRSAAEFRTGAELAFAAAQSSNEPALLSIDVRGLVESLRPEGGRAAMPALRPLPPPLPPPKRALSPPSKPSYVPVSRVLPVQPGARVVRLPPASHEAARVNPMAATIALSPSVVLNAKPPKRAATHDALGQVKPAAPAERNQRLPEQAISFPYIDDSGVIDQDRGPRGAGLLSRPGVRILAMGTAALAAGVAFAFLLSSDPGKPDASLGAPGEPPTLPLAAAPASAGTAPETAKPGEIPPAQPEAVLTPAPQRPAARAAVPPPPGFVRVDPGKFVMGSPPGEPGRGSNEVAHEVEITQAFWLQTTEVTQGDWRQRMTSNPSMYPACGDSCPVENVTWFDAITYANRLSFDEGLPACYQTVGCTGKAPGITACREVRFLGLACTGYRLPTEAEWEYAARAASATATPAGAIVINGTHQAPVLSPIAWHGGNSKADFKGAFDCRAWPQKEVASSRCGPQQVRMKDANSWGLHDMLGNVREWVHDWYGAYPEPVDGAEAAKDPTGPDFGRHKVTRGGSWTDEVRNVRSAARAHDAPEVHDGFYGFRLARTAR